MIEKHMFRPKDKVSYKEGDIDKAVVMSNESGITIVMALDKGLIRLWLSPSRSRKRSE